MQASCQCGLVRFETPAAQPKIFICHCTDCRHQSSSAFGISAMFSRASFEKVVMPVLQKKIKDGDVKIYESPTDSGRIKQCLFCSRCGSRLAHPGKGEEKEGAMVSIKGGCLEGLSKEMLRDAVHIWTRSAVVEIPADAKQYPQEPDD